MQAVYGEPDESTNGKCVWHAGYGFRIPGDPQEGEAEGFSGTISVKIEKISDVIGDNAQALRDEGFDIPQDGWLVTLCLSNAYRVNPEKQSEAFFSGIPAEQGAND